MITSKKHENKSNKYVVTDISISDKPDLKGDWLNIFILLLLYTLQGLQLGLTTAIPIFLQSNKNVTYQDQVTQANNQNCLYRIFNIALRYYCIYIKINKLCFFIGCI